MIAALLAAGLAAAQGAPGTWTLVAAYDHSAVATVQDPVEEPPVLDPLLPPVPEVVPGFVWSPSGAMEEGCGPAKRPDGLGVFDAEALANGLSPYLVLLLEGDGPALSTENLRVAIGRDGPAVPLYPLVEPRFLAFNLTIDIEGEVQGLERYQQLVRTQIEMETCLEHKTGRGWRGHDAGRLRQAFLLDEPGIRNDPSRKYFGGQLDPIPGLLGAPEACISAEGFPSAPAVTAFRGEGRTWLIPTDVWGAELRQCENFELRGGLVDDPPPSLVLSTSAPGKRVPRPPTLTPVQIRLQLSDALGGLEERLRLTMALGPMQASDWELPFEDNPALRVLLPSSRLPPPVRDRECTLDDEPVEWFLDEDGDGFGNPERSVSSCERPAAFVNNSLDCNDADASSHDNCLFPVMRGEERGLIDLLAHIPYHYPLLETETDDGGGSRFTVLMIPNWQLVEAVRRLRDGHDPAEAINRAPVGTLDGVGYLLANPHLIYVQIAPADSASDWRDLASIFRSGLTAAGPLGYTTGLLTARNHIVVVGDVRPNAEQIRRAQRAPHESLVLGSVLLLLVIMGFGVVRLRDLWARPPEERADYWPGPAEIVVAEASNVPESEGGE